MKIQCHREGFLTACQLAGAAVAPRDVKPVLRNLKAIAEGDRCTLMATDLELGVQLDVRGLKVDEPGEALFPAARTVAILREAADEEMTIEAGPDACVIRGEHTEFEMASEDPGAFPEFPTMTEEGCHEITAGVLREMIRRTQFAAAAIARFGATTGILLELNESQAKMVATDGRRLALCKGPAQVKGEHAVEGQRPVIPVKAIGLLERNLSEPDELVRIQFRPNEVLMKTERATIYSRLVEGRFPDYDKVIPSKAAVKVPLVVGPFHAAVRQAAIMTDDESKKVVFKFEPGNLTLQARGAAGGRSRVEMPLNYDGNEMEINFDPKYLTDMLRVMEPDAELTLHMNDANSPAVFHLDANYLYVVVPLVTK